MKGCIKEKMNICLLFECSMCCNPVKIDSRKIILTETSGLPFVEMGGLLIPESHPDSIKLKQYKCVNFNPATGLCTDYFNRPQICRNTTCIAFGVSGKKDQERIICEIKNEKFFNVQINTQ